MARESNTAGKSMHRLRGPEKAEAEDTVSKRRELVISRHLINFPGLRGQTLPDSEVGRESVCKQEPTRSGELRLVLHPRSLA